MDDQGIRAQITSLVEQEHAELQRLERELDQAWDLLRQRQARRDAGQDPADTAVRPAGEVEGYRQ